MIMCCLVRTDAITRARQETSIGQQRNDDATMKLRDSYKIGSLL